MDAFHSELKRCRFPVSPVRADEYGCLERLRLTDEVSNLKNLDGGWSFQQSLHLSWALLLRAYVRTDFVYFALLSNLPEHSSYDIKLAHYQLDCVKDGRSRLEPLVQRLEPQYLATKQVNSGVLELGTRGDGCNGESKEHIFVSDTCLSTFYQHVSANLLELCMKCYVQISPPVSVRKDLDPTFRFKEISTKILSSFSKLIQPLARYHPLHWSRVGWYASSVSNPVHNGTILCSDQAYIP